MAIFGRDFYGLTKYGVEPSSPLSVEPFLAEPDGYNALRVTWKNPPHYRVESQDENFTWTAPWDRALLVRSKTGYAITPEDGETVLDMEQGPPGQFLDTGLEGGVFYYYTLFLRTPSQYEDGYYWYRVGSTSGLALSDTGISDYLWERIPTYFRYIKSDVGPSDPYYSGATVHNPNSYEKENQTLRKFLDVISFGFEYLREYQQTLLRANDPRTTHLENVERLAREFGVPFERAIPANIVRSRVANAAELSRKRGTLEGIRDTVALTTGWDIDIQVDTRNFLRNRDQAEIIHPSYENWDNRVHYRPGDRVVLWDAYAQAGGIYEAGPNGAFGASQSPWLGSNWVYSGGSWHLNLVENTDYWTKIDAENVETDRNYANDAIRNWSVSENNRWSGGSGYVATNPRPQVYLATGVSSPVDSGISWSNALKVAKELLPNRYAQSYSGNYLTTFWLRGAQITEGARAWGSNNLDPLAGVLNTVPLPQVIPWIPDHDYVVGDLVVHQGVSWRSLSNSRNVVPSSDTSAFWEQMGIDERLKICFSFYTHGDFDGINAANTYVAKPKVSFYNEHGEWLNGPDYDVQYGLPLFFDTFNSQTDVAFDERTPEFTFAGEQWDVIDGGFTIDTSGDNPMACATESPSTALITLPSSLTKYRVAVTFSETESDTMFCLILRYVDENNYVRVTPTGIDKKVNGTWTTMTTFFTYVTKGDRVTAEIDGNYLRVAVNYPSVQYEIWNENYWVYYGTVPAVSGAQRVGMRVEPRWT